MISRVNTWRQLQTDHLKQEWKEEEKIKEEATSNVDKNEYEKGFTQE